LSSSADFAASVAAGWADSFGSLTSGWPQGSWPESPLAGLAVRI
jgi:hypothetical protein